MNNFIQEKKSLVLFIVVILFLLLGLLFLNLVKPIKDDAAMVETNVQSLETEIAILQNQLNGQKNEETQYENTYELEKKLPLDRSIDDLILSLQEIQLVSDSRIENISFNNYDSALTEADVAFEDEETEAGESVEESSEESTEQISDETFPPVSDLSEEPSLPENVKLITVSLDVISPDFEHFMQFLKEVEKLERVTRVGTLSFDQATEQDMIAINEEEDEVEFDESITTNMQITTFYYDGEIVE